MKLLLLSPLPPPSGGIARWTTLMLDHLAENSAIDLVHVDTRVPVRSGSRTGPIRRIIDGASVALRTWHTVHTNLKQHSIDVAHINTSGSIGFARDIVTLTMLQHYDVPTVLHLRFGRVPNVLKEHGWEAKLLSRCIRMSRAVIAIDPATEVSVSEHFQKTLVRRIPNFGDSLHAVSRPEERSQTVVFTGRIEPQKGIRDLLEAWRTIPHDGWRLALAGSVSDHMRAEVSRVADVSLLGVLEPRQVQSLLDDSAIFCLPSHTEGFPNSLLEAMLAGSACIATDVGACREMLSPNCGIVVAPRSIPELSAALRDLIGNPDMRKQYSDSARLKANEHYTPKAVIQQYSSLWMNLAGGSRSGK